MKTLNSLIACLCLLLPGCASLDETGPYGGDKMLYNADLTITTAYDVLHRFVSWEYENRAALASFPEVKKAADAIRRDAPGLINSAIALREAYAEAKTKEAADSLSTILALLRSAMVEATKHLSAHTPNL